MLAGRPRSETADLGRTLCVCNGVGVNEIEAAILNGASDIDAVGRHTKAGTGCGSCRSEIRTLLKGAAAAALAAQATRENRALEHAE